MFLTQFKTDVSLCLKALLFEQNQINWYIV